MHEKTTDRELVHLILLADDLTDRFKVAYVVISDGEGHLALLPELLLTQELRGKLGRVHYRSTPEEGARR